MNLDNLRRKARTLKKELKITHSAALDRVAREHGHDKWTALVAAQNRLDRRDNQTERHDEYQPPDGAHLSRFDNPAYVKAIFRP